VVDQAAELVDKGVDFSQVFPGRLVPLLFLVCLVPALFPTESSTSAGEPKTLAAVYTLLAHFALDVVFAWGVGGKEINFDFGAALHWSRPFLSTR
jgi:hypothetical protein